MTAAFERHHLIEAWALSLLMHGIAVTLAVLFVSHIKPLPLQQTFEWNVSIVEASHEEPAASNAQAEPSPAPAQPVLSQVQPIQPVTETPQVITREVPTQQSNVVVQREQPQFIETPKAVERPPVETMAQSPVIQPRHKAVAQALEPAQKATSVQDAQQAERLSVQSVVPVEAPSRIETDEPVHHSAAAISTPATKSIESTDAHPVAPPVVASRPPPHVEQTVEGRVESQPVQQAAVPRESVSPPVSTEPAQSVTKAVQQGPAARADYGWLVESIGKRLAELKRYPPTARLNGWEGKVVLRAVIKSDGNLADVKVQKSSGHQELDEAAMESMRQACPLHMRHDLGRPEIVVNIPVLYALGR